MSSPRAQGIPTPVGKQMAAVSGNPAAENVIIVGNPASTEPIHQLKHPSCHLLENTNREAYLNLCMPLYKAAIKGDWDSAKGILNINRALLTASITRGRETVLHVAAGTKNNIHFVEELVNMMDEEDLALQDIKGNTALSFAAATGTVEIAEILIQKNRSLPTIPGGQGMTPLYMAALFGQSKMAWYLYHKTYEMLNEKSRTFLFFCCIDHDLYDLAMKLLQDDRTLATARKGNRDTALHVLARKSSEFGDQSTSGMCSRLMNTLLPGIKVSYKRNLKQTEALKLVECLWKEMLKHEDDEVMRLLREPSELLFDAAKLGNYEFLSVLIDSYPELIWEIDNNNRSIFHIAVLHRHANIFNLVHETGSIKDIIATFTDDESNNILHLAAKLAPQDQLNLVSGAALQMQRELVWFEEVEKIVQPPFIEMKNKQGKTPRELFTNEHEDLLRKGESWMKDTASSCMRVATIIVTVMFAATLSISGGIRTYDNKGTPNFVKETAFLIFSIVDGVALLSSSTAILMFLYILKSRHAEKDFLISLPLKLMIGITSLFVSITSMMVDFSTAFYLSCHYGLRWVPDLLFRFAIVIVALFAFLQYHLLSDMFFSTYCSYLLFRPRRDMMYSRVKA